MPIVRDFIFWELVLSLDTIQIINNPQHFNYYQNKPSNRSVILNQEMLFIDENLCRCRNRSTVFLKRGL